MDVSTTVRRDMARAKPKSHSFTCNRSNAVTHAAQPAAAIPATRERAPHLAVAADQHVVRLHVAVDDAVAVQVVQRTHQLTRDGPHDVLGQRLVVLQHLEQLAARKLRDDAKLPRRFERIQHVDDVLVAQRTQYLRRGCVVIHGDQ
jgi:hypothetical protein